MLSPIGILDSLHTNFDLSPLFDDLSRTYNYSIFGLSIGVVGTGMDETRHMIQMYSRIALHWSGKVLVCISK